MSLHLTHLTEIPLRKLIDEARAAWCRQWAEENLWPALIEALSKDGPEKPTTPTSGTT
jgi:hypothetical protein